MSSPGHGALWVFDVDGTLIGSIRSDVLRPGALELIESIRRRGSACALWSAGGADYAQRMARRHGLHDLFVAFASKLERDRSGRYVAPDLGGTHVSRRRIYVDDAPDDVPVEGTTVPVRQFLGNNGADAVLTELASRIDHVLAEAEGGAR